MSVCYKGRKQADATGKRLAKLQLPYSLIVKSTMTRALETSKIIEQSLNDVPVESDCLLVEGAPIPPEPPIGQWKSEKHVSKVSLVSIKLEILRNENFFARCT